MKKGIYRIIYCLLTTTVVIFLDVAMAQTQSGDDNQQTQQEIPNYEQIRRQREQELERRLEIKPKNPEQPQEEETSTPPASYNNNLPEQPATDEVEIKF